jgi:hypothetical protein
MARKKKHRTRTSAKGVRHKRQKSAASSIRVPPGKVAGTAPTFVSGAGFDAADQNRAAHQDRATAIADMSSGETGVPLPPTPPPMAKEQVTLPGPPLDPHMRSGVGTDVTDQIANLQPKVSNVALSATGLNEPITPPIEAPREPQHRTLQLETGKYTLRGVPIRLARKKTLVIRSKAQVIREAGLLITVLEDALGYRQGVLHNTPAPELWNQFDLENRAAFELISELVAELKKLNAFLTTQSRATNKSKVVADLQKVGLKVLQRYGTTVAVGAGVLTVGALCTLLQHVGAGDVVENAMFWKRIGH